MTDRLQVALLVAVDSFEGFYEDTLGLDRTTYGRDFRNDFVWTYGEALKPHGVDLIAYIPSTGQSGRDDAPDGFAVRYLPIAGWWSKVRRLFVPGLSPIDRYFSEWLNARLLRKALATGLREDGIGVLYIQEYWTARFDSLTRWSPVPVVSGDHSGGGGIHLKLRKRGAMRRAQAITVQSTGERDRLRERFGFSAEWLTNGIDTGFFLPSDRARDKSMLIVARLEEKQKQISAVIRALRHLDDEWTLTIAGTGPDEPVYRSLVDELGLGDRVRFLGWVGSRETLRDLYQRCGVLVLPSTWEAVTLAVLEAMACGAPVVVSPLGPMTDLIEAERNGLFLENRGPDTIARAVEEAYDERDQLGTGAQATVERDYDSKKQMKRLSEVLIAAAGVSPR